MDGRLRFVARLLGGEKNSALMLVAARLRHVAGTKWGTKKYLNTGLLKLSGATASTG